MLASGLDIETASAASGFDLSDDHADSDVPTGDATAGLYLLALVLGAAFTLLVAMLS